MSDPTEQQAVNPFARQRPMTAEDHQRMEAAKHMANKLKEQIISVFANPHGMQLIDTLVEAFVHKPTCPPGAPKGYGYKREGENSLILYFKHVAEEAQKPVVTQ